MFCRFWQPADNVRRIYILPNISVGFTYTASVGKIPLTLINHDTWKNNSSHSTNNLQHLCNLWGAVPRTRHHAETTYITWHCITSFLYGAFLQPCMERSSIRARMLVRPVPADTCQHVGDFCCMCKQDKYFVIVGHW